MSVRKPCNGYETRSLVLEVRQIYDPDAFLVLIEREVESQTPHHTDSVWRLEGVEADDEQIPERGDHVLRVVALDGSHAALLHSLPVHTILALLGKQLVLLRQHLALCTRVGIEPHESNTGYGRREQC